VFFHARCTTTTPRALRSRDLRWMFFGAGPKSMRLHFGCGFDARFTMSCRKFTAACCGLVIQSGEVAHAIPKIKERTAGGPAEFNQHHNFERRRAESRGLPATSKSVQSARRTLLACVLSCRYSRRQGVIGGCGNDVPVPPHPSSASEQVEKLAKGADVVVHSTIHPIMGPDKGSAFSRTPISARAMPSIRRRLAKRAGANISCYAHDSAAGRRAARSFQDSWRSTDRGGLWKPPRKTGSPGRSCRHGLATLASPNEVIE